MIATYDDLLLFAGFKGYGWLGADTIQGVQSPADVNASSIDVRLGNIFLQEIRPLPFESHIVRLGERTPVNTVEYKTTQGAPFYLEPGEFVLAHTAEKFHLPYHISAEFRLKSTAARMGLSHALAVWCDPGWHGSTLTLELHNISRYHTIALNPGDKVGQMIFHVHKEVPHEFSYAARGAYNNDATASGAKPSKE